MTLRAGASVYCLTVTPPIQSKPDGAAGISVEETHHGDDRSFYTFESFTLLKRTQVPGHI